MTKHFYVYQYASQTVVAIKNAFFNDVESILVAPLKLKNSSLPISNLHVDVDLKGERYYVDLLDLGTVSKRLLKTGSSQNLNAYRDEIKSGIDLLIDGL